MGLLAKNGTKQSEVERQATQNLREKKKKNVSGQARTGDLPRSKGSIRAYLLGGRDNHYTTETSATLKYEINVFKPLTLCFLQRARN